MTSATIRVTNTVDLSPESRAAWETYEAIQRPAWETYRAIERDAASKLAEAHHILGEAASYPRELAAIVDMLPCSLGALNAHADDAGWYSTWERIRDEAIDEGILVIVDLDGGAS